MNKAEIIFQNVKEAVLETVGAALESDDSSQYSYDNLARAIRASKGFKQLYKTFGHQNLLEVLEARKEAIRDGVKAAFEEKDEAGYDLLYTDDFFQQNPIDTDEDLIDDIVGIFLELAKGILPAAKDRPRQRNFFNKLYAEAYRLGYKRGLAKKFKKLS